MKLEKPAEDLRSSRKISPEILKKNQEMEFMLQNMNKILEEKNGKLQQLEKITAEQQKKLLEFEV